MTQVLKALIWDMDGTLLNTLDDIIDSCNETLRAWNLPERPKPEMITFIGSGARHLCHKASGLEGEDLTKFLKDYRGRAMSRNDPRTRIYPGIAEILHDTHDAGIKHGIYTNKPQNWCAKLTEKFFGNDLFDEIVGVEEGSVLKPSAEGIFGMCRKWGLKPSEVAMIGDSPVDWETSVNAECFGICVSWGFRSREILENCGASCIVDDIMELRHVLKEKSISIS